MTDREAVLDRIRPAIEEYFQRADATEQEFVPGETPIRLSEPTFGSKEIMEALDSLLSTWVTMGKKVEQFESSWAEYVGSGDARMANSGSSANLLALQALAKEKRIEPGAEIVLPAVAWSTTLFPILDVDATPVFVDVDPETFTLSIDALKAAIGPDTAAVVPVHLLGNPCEMDAIVDLCHDNDLALVEDCCEAHGATFDGQHVGSFGDLGTFSFFFSHHITTIEGGMVTINDPGLRDRVSMLRAHGWTRDVDDPSDYSRNSPDIDERFLFASHGYNLRPTEIQGAFGLHQLPRLDDFVRRRRANAAYLTEQLQPYAEQFHLLGERKNARCSWFAYPLLVSDEAAFSCAELRNALETNMIETRPILAGNLTRQPAVSEIRHRIVGDLTGTEAIHENGLFIGNHHKLTERHLDFVVSVVDDVVRAA